MAWRVAKSLLKLRQQVDEAHPTRDKANDGTIGDERHAAHTSDHNPWVKDGDMGIVTAIDISHDPANGVDTYAFAEHLRQTVDPRIKYVISNGRIFAYNISPWQWREYHGENKHDHHVHISVKPLKSLYDWEQPWSLGPLALLAPNEQAVKDAISINKGITATVFGGKNDRQKSFYTGKLINDKDFVVALPFAFSGDRPKVVVTNPANGKKATASIEDVGPWNINDPYWQTNTRPQAESGRDHASRRTNLAGIDLSPALASFLGIDGKGKVDWSFE